MQDLIVTSLLIILMGITCITLCVGVSILIIQRYYLKKAESKETERSKQQLTYSKDVLDYIKTVSGQIIVLRFQTFIDGHRLEKVTREKFKNVVEDITKEIHKSIDIAGFNHDLLLYDDEFINKYLIQTCITMCKKMLVDALIDFEE